MTSDNPILAAEQGPETTSDNTAPGEAAATPAVRPRRGKAPTQIPERFVKVFEGYVTHLSAPGGPLESGSVRSYLSHVRQFLAWLEWTEADEVGGDPLATAAGRDGAVRDYRKHLLQIAKRKPRTANAHLAAIDNFYVHLGLGEAKVKRSEPPQEAPRAMNARSLTRFQRAAERATVRDKAIAYLELHAGLRGGEVEALNVGDVRLSARKGTVIVRYGKGGKYREVPTVPKLREALEEWISERRGWPGAAEQEAMFLNARGGRLTKRGAYGVLVSIAEEAGLDTGRDAEFTPHTLRHQAGTEMVRDGVDIVTVAEILGHSIEVARRYSLPTLEDKERALGAIPVDE